MNDEKIYFCKDAMSNYNSKTGKVFAISSDIEATCNTGRCLKYKTGICYGLNGNLVLCTKGKIKCVTASYVPRSLDEVSSYLDTIPKNSSLRLFEYGDLPHDNAAYVFLEMLADKIVASNLRVVGAYSEKRELWKMFRKYWEPLRLRISLDFTAEHVEILQLLSIAGFKKYAVTLANQADVGLLKLMLPTRTKIAVCPAQTGVAIQCVDCNICREIDVVCFISHGSKKKIDSYNSNLLKEVCK